MKKIFLSLLTFVMLVSLSIILIKANTQTSVILTDGVSIRTDGNNGLKWEATVVNPVESYKYGFLFGKGNITDLTVDTQGVSKQEVEGVNSENPTFTATMTKFPKAAVNQDISVRAYFYDGSKYTYSENIVVRNLADVALNRLNLPPQEESLEFVNTVVDYVGENYKGLYVGFDGVISFSSSKYESNPANLEKEFVKDWNSLFGTTWTEFNYDKFNISAIEGSKPLTADSDKDCSGTNAYTFFNTNEATSTKWKWLLNYFLAETSTGVHPNLQINAVLGTGTYTIENESKTYTDLYQLKHLSRSLHNFFKAGAENVDDYPSISFTDSLLFAKVSDYNNQIYAANPNLVKINETVSLPSLEKEGYIFDGYVIDENTPSQSYVVTSDNKSILPQFTFELYNIKFMYGANEFTELSQTYSIEDNLFFPTPVIDGYDFLGWYEDNNYSGEVITSIEFGTTGNKVYYAKFEEQTYVNVNVSFDTNGGKFAPSLQDLAGDYELEVDKKANYAANITYLVPNTTTSTLQYQNKILLNYDSTLGLYKVIATDTATKTLTEAAGGSTWTHAIANSASDITENVSAGNYIYLNADGLSSGMQVAKIFESLDSLKSYSTILKKPTTLPVPSNGDVEFAGWRSSVDGSIIKEYPGYMSNPGDIIYTAQWGDVVDAEVTFDYNGGISEELYNSNGTKLTSLQLSIYNSSIYTTDVTGLHVFIYDVNYENTTLSSWSTRICIAKNKVSGLYEIVSVIPKLEAITAYPSGTEYVIVISTGYTGTYIENFDSSKLSVGNVVTFDKDFTTASSSNLVTANFYDTNISNSVLTTTIVEGSTLPTPTREDYLFGGWYDENDHLYDNINEFIGISNISLIAKWHSTSNVNSEVTFDYNGGVTEELYKAKGTTAGSLQISNYNGNFWSLYADNTFIFTAGTSMNPQGAKRIYIAENTFTGLYVILGTQTSGASNIPADTEFIITVSDSYSATGTYDDKFDISKLSVGDIVFFDKAFSTASTSNLVTLSFYKGTVSSDSITESVDSSTELVTPYKEGYRFAGWYDENDKLYSTYKDFAGVETITVTARWVFDDRIVGSFDTVSWVEKSSSIKLNYLFVGGSNLPVSWKSETPGIASVDKEGNVTGEGEGLAKITVYATEAPTISFTFYVTVVDDASTMLKVLLESNNDSIFIRENLGIGAGTPSYYYDAVGSVSKLLFEDYVEYKSYYLSSPSNKSTLTGSGTGGVDFITFHYAADMPYSAKYSLTGGKNLASYNKTCNTNGTGASWHYSTGNDGVWYCQNVAYGAWHAGTSKTMTWVSSGVTTSQVGTDVYTTDVTCGSDNYFYIKGVKTTVKNTTGYSYKKLNDQGLAVKLSGSTWYLGGHYYNSSYGYICSLGGNCNSIGIESSVREGSDLWLTWQYSAQLCAKLLIQFNLPIQRLVGHHFFSGKDCPQPLLENDLEIWYEFVKMVEQQMAYFKAYGSQGAAPTLSTNSSYINSKGRVTSFPTYSSCETYTLSYKDGSATKTVTLSTIIPGTVA